MNRLEAPGTVLGEIASENKPSFSLVVRADENRFALFLKSSSPQELEAVSKTLGGNTFTTDGTLFLRHFSNEQINRRAVIEGVTTKLEAPDVGIVFDTSKIEAVIKPHRSEVQPVNWVALQALEQEREEGLRRRRRL